MMLRLVGDGQHKLMRKRLRKVAMQVGMKVMEEGGDNGSFELRVFDTIDHP